MADYKTDLEIAREAKKEKIIDLAKNKLSVDDEHLIPFGHYKAKINENGLDELEKRKDGTLIIEIEYLPVAAESPGPLDKKIPLGFKLSIFWAFVLQETTVTLQLKSEKYLKIFFFIP